MDTVKSVDVPGVHGGVVLNADGTALGQPVGGATSANQTNGSQKTQIVDAGGEVVTVTGGKLDVNASASLSGEAIPATGATTAVTVQIADGSGNQITSFGGGTQYTEDAAAAANPVGTSLILVREDGRAGSLTTADGDNVAARGNNKGELYVKTTDSDALLTTIDADTSALATTVQTIGTTPLAAVAVFNNSDGQVDFATQATLNQVQIDVGTLSGAVAGTEMQVDVLTMPTVTVNAHAVTNAGTFAVQVDGAALTSLQLADDVVATLGTTTYTEASTKGTTIGAVRRDADTTLVDTTNEIGPLQMNAAGQLKVEVFSGEALPVTMTSTTVTGTVAVTQSGTWDEVGINDSGNSITVDYATTGSGTATGALRVELPTNGTGTVGLNAGTNNIGDVDIVSGTVTTVSTLTGGGIAHDSADSGNPHKVGYIAYSPDGTTPGTAVAELDRSNGKSDLNGRHFVNTASPQSLSFHSDGSSALTDTSVAADPGDGFQIVVTSIIFSTGAATACNIFFEEGATKVLGPWYLEATAGRGVFWYGHKPITASTALTVTTSAAIAQSLDVTYFIQAV